MNDVRTKKIKMTDQAMKMWHLPKGAEILDIGCGQGEAVEYLEKEFGYKPRGIDISKEMIEQGLERNPNLNIQQGDGEFLDGFLSYTFDGVLMESVLALIGLPDEALHEAYCVLKKGGKLFISDLYIKDPDADLLKAVKMEAENDRNTPHHHDHESGGCGTGHSEADGSKHKEGNEGCSDCSDCGECDGEAHEHDHENIHLEESRHRAVVFRSEDKFLIEPLIQQLEEIGYININWKDCSEELAESIMDSKSLQAGYFMLTAEKPA